MPKKYFCEYCGIYLTNSSPRTRKEHSRGRKHVNNKIEYYSQFLYEFQQNTYNNLVNMAAKINKPAVNDSSQIPIQQPHSINAFQRFIIPTNISKPSLNNNI
jgi:hypothetical protein